jgi:RNA polymerase sigma-70 factor (ECF subfamily)
LIEDSAAAIPATSQPDPEREAASRGIGAAIRDCLLKMVDARRRAVTLHLLGHTVPEIADLLGHRVKQSDNLVYRGMADLRRCLSGKGITP